MGWTFWGFVEYVKWYFMLHCAIICGLCYMFILDPSDMLYFILHHVILYYGVELFHVMLLDVMVIVSW